MVFKYTTSYLVMICYFNYAWLLVLGVGCWVLGVGCWVLGVGCWVSMCDTPARRQAGRQATISMCDAWVRVTRYGLAGTGYQVRVSRYGLPGTG